MKTLSLLLGATALASVLVTQANAATISVTGSNPVPTQDAGNIITTYPGGSDPTFTGTFDDVTGAFNFTLDAGYSQFVDVFGGVFSATFTYTADGTISSAGIGSLVVDTNTSVCVGDAIVCSVSSPTYDSFTWNGSTGLISASSVDPSGGVLTSTYVIEASAVPVPAAAWLFGSAMVGLVGIARRRRV